MNQETRTSPPKAALYVRVSTVEQAQEGYSIPAQEKMLRELCARKGYEVHDLYADCGISGKDIDHRPEMMRLIEDVKAGRIGVVCVFSLSRLSRSVSDLYQICDLLKRHGASLESSTEPFDTSSPIGMAVVGILGVVAQLEREQTAERVKVAMLERASQGKRTCSYVLGYDLDGSDNLAINPEESEIVRFIFDQFIACQNLSEVARLCRERGYRGKRGYVLVAYKIFVILTRPLYVGYNSYLGMLYRGAHPCIVPIEQYNEVQRILIERKKNIKHTKSDTTPKNTPVIIAENGEATAT